MNLFLEQKINPSKSKLAKIFAIFLVCFFVGGAVNNALAQTPNDGVANSGIIQANTTVGSVKNYETGSVYQMVTTKTTNLPAGIISGLYSYTFGGLVAGADSQTLTNFLNYFDPGTIAYYKVDPLTGTVSNVPIDLSETLDQLVKLPYDPVALNALNTNFKYSYAKKAYTYTDPNTGQVTVLDPVKDLAKINDILKNDKVALGAVQLAGVKASQIAQQGAVNVSRGGAATDPKKLVERPCDITDLACMLAKGIYYITIKPASLFLGMSGWFLDSVFKYTVVDLRANLKKNPSSGIGFYAVITMVWGIFRDIINMSFIFLLLYASIITILRADTTQLKKTISNIVIVAILINFSLFFVEIIIDVSNNAAVVIYNTITQPLTTQNNIAAAFMDKLELRKLLDNAIPTTASGNTNFTGMIAISIFGSIFILILAVIFFVMSILFVLRFVEFIILMMMSPVGIAGIAIPKLNQAFGGDYWKSLLNQCFFAPIMLFFLWISIKMLDAVVNLTKIASPNVSSTTGANATGLSGMLTDGAQARVGIGAYLLGFTVIVFILIKGMAYAKSMSATGASGMQAGFMKYSGADWLQNKMNNAPKAIGTRAVTSTGSRALNSIASSRLGMALGGTRLGNGLYNQINKGGANWRNAVDERKKKETARAELRTTAATQQTMRDTAEQQQILADANILRAEERVDARRTADADREAANATLAGNNDATIVPLINAVIDETTHNPYQIRDLTHAQEIRAEMVENLAETDRDISNFDQQLRRLNSIIDATTAAGGLPTTAQIRERADVERELQDRRAQRVDRGENLRKLNALLRPVQQATQNLERIDTDLGRLYSGYNPLAFDESVNAINNLAASVRRSGHESARNVTSGALSTAADARANETQAQYLARNTNREVLRLQTQTRGVQNTHAQENATGQITNGILPGFGLNQAGREAAAREYRDRYTGQNGGNR